MAAGIVSGTINGGRDRRGHERAANARHQKAHGCEWDGAFCGHDGTSARPGACGLGTDSGGSGSGNSFPDGKQGKSRTYGFGAAFWVGRRAGHGGVFLATEPQGNVSNLNSVVCSEVFGGKSCGFL